MRALGEVFAELQVARVSPARLSRALASLAGAQSDTQPGASADGAGAHAAGLGPLFAEYRATLGRLGRVDAEQRAVRALDAPARASRPVGAHAGAVLRLRRPHPLQLDAIETLGRVVDADVTVSLAYEPGRTAFAGRAGDAFTRSRRWRPSSAALPPRAEYYARPARDALSHLERSLFEPRAPAAGVSTRATRCGCSRAAASARSSSWSRARSARCSARGWRRRRSRCSCAPAATDLDLLEEVFSASGIPFALRRSRPFADTAIGRALIGLLRCVPAPERSRADTQAGSPGESAESDAGELEDLLAWLRAPGLLAHGSARGAGRRSPTAWSSPRAAPAP